MVSPGFFVCLFVFQVGEEKEKENQWVGCLLHTTQARALTGN